MVADLLDWSNLVVRVVHLVAGIAWIGSSFYFIWLDSALTPPTPPRGGVEGELWMVHSGGFYRVEKRLIGPGELPAVLHWFKWEAAITWASGIVLLAIVYYLTGGVYLVDPSVADLSPAAATAISVALLLAGWLVYDALWRSSLGRAGAPATAVSLVLLAATVFGLTRLLNGRAAYVHVGALLGTLMVANVWLRILPAQQRMIDATMRGEQPDYGLGAAAKRRSVHNSYMTFPVLFIMVSNHFPSTWGSQLNWLLLALLIVAGAAARHAMIARTAAARWTGLGLGAAAFAAAVTVGRWDGGTVGRTDGAAGFAQVREIIGSRCLSCHSAWPTDDVFKVAPNGVTFDSPDEVLRRRDLIRERVVTQRTMPLANKTGMTEAERALIARWAQLSP